jgi:hypothetical protein
VGSITSLYLSLHTASPGEAAASGQQTNEATYGGYARIAVARDATGWDIADLGSDDWQASNDDILAWPMKTDAGTQNITHVGVGTLTSGVGTLLYFIPVESSPVAIAQYFAPQIAANALKIKEL